MNGVIRHDVALHCIEWHAMLLDGVVWHGGHDVAWYGTRLHCTGCMALHCISWCDIAWHDLAVLIIHIHCCWDSRFGVLPRRAITLLHSIWLRILLHCTCCTCAYITSNHWYDIWNPIFFLTINGKTEEGKKRDSTFCEIGTPSSQNSDDFWNLTHKHRKKSNFSDSVTLN